MKFIKVFFTVCALSFFLFAQDLQEDLYKTAGQTNEETDFFSPESDTVLLELNAQRVRNHRYIVVSAVMMMLFAGLSMASVSTLNPE